MIIASKNIFLNPINFINKSPFHKKNGDAFNRISTAKPEDDNESF